MKSHDEAQLCIDKILVVEDELTLMETLKYNLERQGYQVHSADNGLAALEIARREHPDLILLDIGSLSHPAPRDEHPHPHADCPRR